MNNLFYRPWIYYFVKELLWMALTGGATYLVLFPVTSKIDFIYWRQNALFIFVFLTWFRYSVTFRSLRFLRPSSLRFILFTLNFSLFFYLLHWEQKFVLLADNFYTEDFGFPKVILFDADKQQLFKYLYTEIVFFGTGSLLVTMALQARLIISYWQYYKYQADARLQD
jgi:hypothetical protein